jgi:hypothetical protein
VGQLPDDAEFWAGRGEGLAVFLSPDFIRAYRLPLRFGESCTIERRLNIKPLLPVVDHGERYLVLALSQNHVQVFEATPSRINRITAKGLPENKRLALNFDGADRGEQLHLAVRGVPRKQAAVFHGQGGEKDTAKTDLAEYCQIIARALDPTLRGETAPLLLAGVDYLLPIFRQKCSYPHLLERHLTGNCDLLTNQQLHQQSWQIMRPFFDRPRRDALARLRSLLGTGKASVDCAEVATAATTGKIAILLVDVRREQMGRFDPVLGQAVVCPQPCDASTDLVNFALAETLLHGGMVFSALAHELPGQAALGAIYRY